MKKVIAVLSALLILLAMAFPVTADQPNVIDTAGLLTPEEIRDLEWQIDFFSEEYGMDVVILTVGSLNGYSAANYADDYYYRNGYGFGGEDSGLLFLLALNDREWYISTFGLAARDYSDDCIDEMAEYFVPLLSAGDYYGGFSLWLDQLPGYRNSGSSQSMNDHPSAKINYPVTALIGLIVAGIVILIMRSKMNTAKRQIGAREYLRQGSYHLTQMHDMFLYSHVSKTPRAKNNSSSGGGSSHGGRGGRF